MYKTKLVLLQLTSVINSNKNIQTSGWPHVCMDKSQLL